MGQLFRFEFRKLFRQKSFYICGCVLIGLILLTAVTLNMIYSLSQGNMETGGVTVSASDDGFLYTGIFMLVQATLPLYWLYFFPSLYAATTPMAL